MIGSIVAVGHFARAGKKFSEAARAAERSMKLFEQSQAAAGSWERAIIAAQAGDVVEKLRQTSSDLQSGQLSNDDLLNWRGPLPPGMTGAE